MICYAEAAAAEAQAVGEDGQPISVAAVGEDGQPIPAAEAAVAPVPEPEVKELFITKLTTEKMCIDLRSYFILKCSIN